MKYLLLLMLCISASLSAQPGITLHPAIHNVSPGDTDGALEGIKPLPDRVKIMWDTSTLESNDLRCQATFTSLNDPLGPPFDFYKAPGVLSGKRVVQGYFSGDTFFVRWEYEPTVFGQRNCTMTMADLSGDFSVTYYKIVRLDNSWPGMVRFYDGDRLFVLYDSIIGTITIFEEDGSFVTHGK